MGPACVVRSTNSFLNLRIMSFMCHEISALWRRVFLGIGELWRMDSAADKIGLIDLGRGAYCFWGRLVGGRVWLTGIQKVGGGLDCFLLL